MVKVTLKMAILASSFTGSHGSLRYRINNAGLEKRHFGQYLAILTQMWGKAQHKNILCLNPHVKK